MIKKTFFILGQILIILFTIIVYRSFTVEQSPEKITKIIEQSLIKNQSFLIKRELYVETIIKKEEKGLFWGTDKKALIIAKGKVPYGLDLNHFSSEQIRVDSLNKKIELKLESPKIYDIIVSELNFYDIQTGIFINEANYLRDLYESIQQEAKQTLKDHAEYRLVSEVDKQIKDELTFFISNLLSDTDYIVSIEFINTSIDTLSRDH